MASLETPRLFARSIITGLILTLLVLAMTGLGLLSSFDGWLYDRRAMDCQIASAPPTDRLVHVDIDDAALEFIGRWPWPRATLARVLDEIHLAAPAAIGIDVLFPEPQEPRSVRGADGAPREVNDDDELAASFRRCGNVVLATSFELAPQGKQSPAFAAAMELLRDDLEVPEDAVAKHVAATGHKLTDQPVGDLFVAARRAAMRERIGRELDRAPTASRAQLVATLMPHADPTVNSPLLRLLDREQAVAIATRALRPFGAPVPAMKVAPLHGALSAIPLAAFSDVAHGCGFANYDIFDNAIIRAVPLFVEFEGRLYPQMGLALACATIGADLGQLRVEGTNVIIPSPHGAIAIPTSTYRSTSLRREVPLIAAVPWFGTHDWRTMYDVPAHQAIAAHLSVNAVWDACLTRDRIARNNASIDKAVSIVLGEGTGNGLRLNPDLARRYAAAPAAPENTAERAKIARSTRDELKESGWLEQYAQVADTELKPQERLQRDELREAERILRTAVEQNAQLVAQLQSQRRELARRLGGKGVLVGHIATGFMDVVTTSLHARCPGVVVHGVIANAVLTGRWWRMAPPWVTVSLTLAFGLLAAALDGWLSPLKAAACTLALASGYWLINGLVLFAYGRWLVGVAGPMTAIFVVWAGCALVRLIAEGLERIRVATELSIFRREMELARNVQMALIPPAAPEIAGLEASGWTLPADLTGGDCFDLWALPNGRLGILLADASGHGLAPAMIVSQVRTLVRALSAYENSPHALLSRVNARIALDLEAGRFVTAFLAFLGHDGSFEWASAGHGPMFWCPDGVGEMRELDSTGIPLGFEPEWVADEPGPSLLLEPTGLLIALSDGIFEAMAPDRSQFGSDRVKEILHDCCGKPTGEIIARIREDVQQWQGKVEPEDDQTIIVVRRVAAAIEVTTDVVGTVAGSAAGAAEPGEGP